VGLNPDCRDTTVQPPKVITSIPDGGLSIRGAATADLFNCVWSMERFLVRSRFLRSLTIFALLFLFTALASRATSAEAPTPTPQQKSTTLRAPVGSFQLFIPMVQGGTASQTAPKKGAGLTYQDCASATEVNAVWEYGWAPSPPDCAGIENIPMIWGAGDVSATLGGNSQWIMGFNEPDSASQANLSPAQAATLWYQIEQTYPNRKLLAPAPSGADANWLVDFRNAYIAAYGTPPRLDGLAVHCYAWYASQCIPFTQQFESWASSWGVPEVWVTEFSFATTSPSSPSQSLQEAQQFISWLEGQPQVTHLAWFASKIQGTEWWLPPGFDTPLANWSTGQLTSFGTMYLPYR
jgi:Glycosyl hydrolase catalytic core